MSKTYKGSVPSKSAHHIALDGGQHLLMSCNKGANVYILDVVSGANVHTASGSDRFWEVVETDVTAGFGPRLAAEFDLMAAKFPAAGWPGMVTKLNELKAAA